MKQVRITEAFIFAFETLKKYPMLLLAPSIFLNLISNSFSMFVKPLAKLPGLTAMASQSPVLDKLTSLFSNLTFSPFVVGLIIFVLFVFIILLAVSIIIGITLQIGYIRIAIHAFDHTEEEPTWKIYNNFGTGIIGKYFWTSLLIGLMVLGGLILLIVPGVIISLMYQFTLFILVEKKLKTNEALQRSNQLTDGIKWQLFGFALLVGFLMILIELPISLLQTLKLNFLYLPLETIVSPIVAMFFTIAGIFIYKDINSQVESLDNLIAESSDRVNQQEESEVK